MQIQLNNAFAALNAKLAASQLTWFNARYAAVRAYYQSAERLEVLNALRRTPRGEAEKVRLADANKLQALAGGKTWLDAIWSCQNATQIEALIAKNVKGLIAKRDATIIAALNKKDIKEIPEFELVEVSDGVEGLFVVSGHVVTIRTIVAGGYNIQCLHQRTLVKVK